MEKHRERYIQYLESVLFDTTDKLSSWRNTFVMDPHHALEWSQIAFRASAENRVASEILVMARSDQWSDPDIIREIHTLALQAGRHMHSISSSDTMNAYNRELCVAWATFAERTDNWLSKGGFE